MALSISASVTRMVGHLFVLFSLGAYTRHVTLEAEGLIASRPAKPKKKKAPKPKAEVVEKPPVKEKTTTEKPSKDKPVLAVDPPQTPKPHITPRTDLGSSRPAATANATATSAAKPVLTLGGNRTPVAPADDRVLSRTDKKKLKREQRNAARDADSDEDDE